MNRIDRLTGIILLLQSHRVITAEQIAAHYEMSVRTVYRDLAALGEAGVPIVAEAGVGYSLMRGYHIPPVMFTEPEAAALFMSGEVTEQVADDTLRDSLRSALLKVRSVLPKDRHDSVNRLKQTVGVWLTRSRKEDAQQAVMPLQQAVSNRRCVSLRYNAGGRGELTQRVVEPVGMMYYAREWHLIAYCRLRQDFRDFRLDRVLECQVLAERFSGHENFSVKEFLVEVINNHELTPVTLIFDAGAMERARREMSCEPMTERTLADGRTQVEMLAWSSEWFTGWVLSFGPQVEVLHPPEVRQLVRTKALEMAQRHE